MHTPLLLQWAIIDNIGESVVSYKTDLNNSFQI